MKRYPWDRLRNVGDSFVWGHAGDELSLRSQAHKQSVRRQVVISVRKLVSSPPRKTVLLVTYERGMI